MRITYFKLIAIVLALGVLFTSCEQWIDPEINEDPDAAVDVTPNMLLPAAQLDLAYTAGGADIAGYLAIWSQQISGTDRQFATINRYNITQTDVDNPWNGIYNGSMMDLNLLIDKAEEEGSPHFAGVAKVLMAVALGNLTDMWGDIPYSEAFQGLDNLNPAYDSQDQIYSTINTLLTDAINQLDPGADNTRALSGDLVYGNDPAKWRAAAYTLRARYNLHLSARGEANYGNIISDLDNGIASVADDCQFVFGSGESTSNPMYQFITQRTGYAQDNTVFQNMLEDNDPRSSVLYYGNADDQGFYTKINAPVIFTQYTEALFIRAEANYRDDSPADAKTNLKNAVGASMTKYGVDGTAYTDSLNTVIDGLSGDGLLQEIMEQKYIHMMFQPEAYVDIRRTGYPELAPVAGDKLPLRFPYPTDEVDYNGDNVPDLPNGIFTPLWWDQ